jgi:hypothetical protein
MLALHELSNERPTLEEAVIHSEDKAGRRIRTDDLLITNQLLYQLSYAGISSLENDASPPLEGTLSILHAGRVSRNVAALHRTKSRGQSCDV